MKYYPIRRRGLATEPLAVTLGIAKKVERDPCQRCGCRGDLGCEHGVTRKLTVRTV